MTHSVKNIIIVCLILLNIVIIIKSSKLQTTKNAYIRQNSELNNLLLLHKNYIIENNQEIAITFDDIFEQTYLGQKQIKEDTVIVIMIPQNVCMSCVSSLFSDLANLKIPKENLYLIHEQPIKNIERDWYAYKNENYIVDTQKKIFTGHDFNAKIILAKLKTNEKKLHFFRYESELHEYLNHFIQSTSKN